MAGLGQSSADRAADGAGAVDDETHDSVARRAAEPRTDLVDPLRDLEQSSIAQVWTDDLDADRKAARGVAGGDDDARQQDCAEGAGPSDEVEAR